MSENNSTGVSRRTLAKGVAWAVPAVAVTAAAPAYAGSPSCEPVIDLKNSCKHANRDSYKLVFMLSANCADACTLEITRIYQATGQAGQYWSGSAGEGDAIVICEAANMSSKIMVTATISCPGQTGVSRNYEVTVNQITSTGCSLEYWAGVCPGARVSTDTTTTTAGTTTSTTTSSTSGTTTSDTTTATSAEATTTTTTTESTTASTP